MGKKKKWHFKGLNLKDKYRLGIYNDTTYEQILHFRLKGREVLIVTALAIVLLIMVTTLLIAFTPIRELIPGYPSAATRRTVQHNLLKVDSLENVVKEWEHYINNTIRVLSGDNVQIVNTVSTKDTSLANKPFDDFHTRQDSLFRQRVENAEQFDLLSNTVGKSRGILDLHFMTPLKGKISAKFDISESHFGIDIVAQPNAVVVSTLDGTVIMSEWTVETGNVIQIQHSDNLISIYKHNAKLLKKQGAHVKAGEAIAIMGNSGELTSGSHLHFEIWYKGTPIDPEQYIIF